MQITLDEETHIYRVDTSQIYGVTEALKDAGWIDDQWYTEEGRLRGQYIHHMTVLEEYGRLNWSKAPQKFIPYIEAFNAFRKDTEWQSILVEQIVYNATQAYAGRLDRTGRIPQIKLPIVLDIKTGASPGWVRLQLSGYQNCLDDYHYRYILTLKPNGKYIFKPLRADLDALDTSVFLTALHNAQNLRWERGTR